MSSSNSTKITVSPGRLGITLQMIPRGARVMGVLAESALQGVVSIGDIIIAIDGNRVTSVEDITGGMGRVRTFEIAKEGDKEPNPQPGDNNSDAAHKGHDTEMKESDDDDTLRPKKQTDPHPQTQKIHELTKRTNESRQQLQNMLRSQPVQNEYSDSLRASCDQCRVLKTKCDGQWPCSSCRLFHLKREGHASGDDVNENRIQCVYSKAKKRGPAPGAKKRSPARGQKQAETNYVMGKGNNLADAFYRTYMEVLPLYRSGITAVISSRTTSEVDRATIKQLMQLGGKYEPWNDYAFSAALQQMTTTGELLTDNAIVFRLNPAFGTADESQSKLQRVLDGAPNLSDSPKIETTPRAQQKLTQEMAKAAGREQFIMQLKGDIQNKVQYPFLKAIGAFDHDQTWLRHQALSELLQYNTSRRESSSIQLGKTRTPHEIICVPLERKKQKKYVKSKDTLLTAAFMDHEKETGLLGRFVNAWGAYCEGTQEDAADLLLLYLSRRFPERYVAALKQSDGVELTQDYVSHDGTNDVTWNSFYSQLLKYKEEHGDCKVNTKTSELGKWVLKTRGQRSGGIKKLTPKRIELLDSIGFLWTGLADGTRKQQSGGDPRRNRAIAAQLVWPHLSPREALLLGGFDEEHLNEVRQPLSETAKVHTWRTNLAFYKERMASRLKSYNGNKNIDAMVAILKGEDEDRFQQVFGDCADLLPGFLEAAEERERNGTSHTPRRGAKRKHDDVVDAASDEGEMSGYEYEQGDQQYY